MMMVVGRVRLGAGPHGPQTRARPSSPCFLSRRIEDVRVPKKRCSQLCAPTDRPRPPVSLSARAPLPRVSFSPALFIVPFFLLFGALIYSAHTHTHRIREASFEFRARESGQRNGKGVFWPGWKKEPDK